MTTYTECLPFAIGYIFASLLMFYLFYKTNKDE